MFESDILGKNPLEGPPVIETDDRDEALVFAEGAFGSMKPKYFGHRDAFWFMMKASQLVDTQLISHEQNIVGGAKFDIETNANDFSLQIPVCGGTTLSLGRKTIDLATDKMAAILGADQRAQWRDPDGYYAANSYNLDRRLVNRRFRILTGLDAGKDIEFDGCIDLSGPSGQEFLKLARMPFGAGGSTSAMFSHPSTAVLFEELLVNLLLTVFPHSRSADMRGSIPLTSVSTVKKCEEYLEAHAEEVVTIGAIAEAIGVSVRSLQRTFQKNTGTTPMRRLKEIRLDRARERLLGGNPEQGVTQIALQCGFSHLGAFSADYKARFGESPSDTLRKSL